MTKEHEYGRALEAFKSASSRDKADRAASDDFMTGLLLTELEKYAEATPYLEACVGSKADLPDRLARKYLTDVRATIEYENGVVASLPVTTSTATILLAHGYSHTERNSDAITVLQEAYERQPDQYLLASLCEALAGDQQWELLLGAVADASVVAEWDVASVIRGLEAHALAAMGDPAGAESVERSFLEEKLNRLDDEPSAAALRDFHVSHGRADTGYAAYLKFLRQQYAASGTSLDALKICQTASNWSHWDDVIDTVAASHIQNRDDTTFQIKLLQADALEHKNLDAAALAIYRECLAFKPHNDHATTAAQVRAEEHKRDPELLREARYRRGRLYLKLGKHGMGRRDLGRVYAEDPNYRDAARLLEE